MKTKRNKIIITLCSVVAFGLTTAGLQAQDTTGDQTRTGERLQWGKDMEKPVISDDLKAEVEAFRAARAELLADFREAHAKQVADMMALREQYRNGDIDEVALIDGLKILRADHKAEARDRRDALRDQGRAFREAMKAAREAAKPVQGE